MTGAIRLKFFLLTAFVAAVFTLKAQVVLLANGSFTGTNFAGPAYTSITAGASSRYAYIYPQSTVSSLRHGDSIQSISFIRNGGSNSLIGTCSMKIYMRTTVNNNYGTRGLNWNNQVAATGMTLVYDGDPSTNIGSNDGWVRFTFISPYVVDTVLGKNLEILVEYRQTSAQNSSIYWSYENSGSVSGFSSNQTKFARVPSGSLPDTTNASTEWHPSIRIEFPRSSFDVAVTKMYSMGKLPVPLGNPDTVKAIVMNVGKKAATFKAYLQSSGANNLIDSATYQIGYLEEKLITLPLLYPDTTGMDTLRVILQKDSGVANNVTEVYRLATNNIFSYKDPTQPIAGGIGFNGSTGDFVARFFTADTHAINQISVSFSGSNQRFQLGIWKNDGLGGRPGTNIWTSDTLQTSPAFVTPVVPSVTVNGSFYVGVRQIGTVNVAFGYQPEVPVRSGTFFFASPLGDTSWIDFSPLAPFKFAIEPRLQAVNDLSPLELIKPKDTIVLNNAVTMAPAARIINYGSNDQLTPFSVKINILRYGELIYTSSRQDTLSSELTRTVVFDSSFLPTRAGDYDIQVITLLSNDQMRDNDTLRSRITVAKYRDVGPGTVFDPVTPGSYEYEQFVDTIYPTVFVQNYGLDRQGPFTVRAQIFDSTGFLIYQDTRQYTLTELSSVLASFNSFPCLVRGTYRFRAITELIIDSDRRNDTVTNLFRIVRSNDVSIASIIYPANASTLLPPVQTKRPEAILINTGDAHQADPFENYCEIYYGGNLIYRDSVYINSFKGVQQNLLFRNFQPTAKGYYTMKVYSSLPGDQLRSNDTLISVFAVGVPDDVEVTDISPAPASMLQLDSFYPTSVTVRNNGYNPQNTPFAVVMVVRKGISIHYIKVGTMTLDSGETRTLVLDTSLRFSDTGTFDVRAFTTLSKDFIRTNDTLKTTFSTVKSRDIGVTRILFPTDSDTLLTYTQTVRPRVLVENFGDSAVSDRFPVTLVMHTVPGGVQLYKKSIDTMFEASQTLELEFPGISVSNSIEVKFTAYTDWSRDQYRRNDTATSSSRFMLLYNMAADQILIPGNDTVLVSNRPAFPPQAVVKNTGIRSAAVFESRLHISLLDTISMSETVVYSDTLTETDLPGGLSRTLTFRPFPLPLMQPGVYRSRLEVTDSNDQVSQNNQIQSAFRITEPVSVEDVRAGDLNIYPVPACTFLYIQYENEVLAEGEIEVRDVHGRVCLRAHAGSRQLDVSKLSPGIYLLKIHDRLIKFVVDR